jgi:8-oxo-dGTP pyrophosphatase MutT (NUDIX family)
VAVAIVTGPLDVLVGRRRDGHPPWTFPGGKIEPGESPEASELMSGMFGLVREHLRSKLRG